ncbi:HAMP domain-containing protein [filamentous cyanobacterium LEGE 11480]|uniref:histidine kinase n=1 Tax=Romeriopsis navalis LEGE 11480 TaxID=2777977 RepID=A0A928VSB5_9CYAN|nr:cache domain-containing protein [Romeriopsis navalis]MBE9031194.1 HAMP domain-containing protein [Romeriopsis navalis LEGE 11480]
MTTASSQAAAPKRTISLQAALVLPFLLAIFGAVGMTGYLAIRNGQQTVDDMALRLEQSTSKRIEQRLDNYLPLLPKLTKINLDAAQSGNLQLANLTQMGRVFCSQMQNFEIGYAAFANPQGDFIGVERLATGKLLINEQSTRTNGKLAVYPATANCDRGPLQVTKDGYDFRQESWYNETRQAKTPLWSSIYNWEDKPEILSVSFNHPLYDAEKRFQGVISSDFILTQLSGFLRDLEVSQSSRVFLIERSGNLIASSADETPYKLLNKTAKRLPVEESRDAVIRGAAAYLRGKFENFTQIDQAQSLQTRIQGQMHYLHVSPWRDEQGLDWLIVMAVPESDFLGTVQANTRQTIFLCLIALIVSTGIGLWTSRGILRPIRSISQASDALAHGQSEVAVPESNITELNRVAQSFNDMAQRLSRAMLKLQTDNQTLGDQVEEKSLALAEAVQRIRHKQGNSAQKQREQRVKLMNLSMQIGYPVTSMQGELGSAHASLRGVLEELLDYREQVKTLPLELRQEISSVDLDLLIADLQKRIIMLEQGSHRIDDLSSNLNQYIQQMQEG